MPENSDIEQPTDPSDVDAKQETWLVHFNETIVGFYANEGEALSALNGYSMSNPVTIDDTLEALKVTQ